MTAVATLPETSIKRIPLNRIRIDRKLSPRAGIDRAHVKSLALLRSRGIEYDDPIVVVEQAADWYLLIGGEHRVLASRLAGDTDIAAEVRTVPAHLLLWTAVEDNATHGKPLTPLECVAVAARLHLEGHPIDAISRLVNLERTQLEREFRRRRGLVSHARVTDARPVRYHRRARCSPQPSNGHSVESADALPRSLDEPVVVPAVLAAEHYMAIGRELTDALNAGHLDLDAPGMTEMLHALFQACHQRLRK